MGAMERTSVTLLLLTGGILRNLPSLYLVMLYYVFSFWLVLDLIHFCVWFPMV